MSFSCLSIKFSSAVFACLSIIHLLNCLWTSFNKSFHWLVPLGWFDCSSKKLTLFLPVIWCRFSCLGLFYLCLFLSPHRFRFLQICMIVIDYSLLGWIKYFSLLAKYLLAYGSMLRVRLLNKLAPTLLALNSVVLAKAFTWFFTKSRIKFRSGFCLTSWRLLAYFWKRLLLLNYILGNFCECLGLWLLFYLSRWRSHLGLLLFSLHHWHCLFFLHCIFWMCGSHSCWLLQPCVRCLLHASLNFNN